MKISAALIVRDEEEHLRDCLASLAGVVDEIVVVDTGSVDATIAIAREFTDKIYEFEWVDDFAAARNAALEHVTGDYVLQIDGDESVMNQENAGDILRAFAQAVSPSCVGTVDIVSRFWSGGAQQQAVEPVYRFFKKGYFMYQGAIHEQVVAIQAQKVEAPTGLQFHHSGYDQDTSETRKKQDRNLRILRRELEKNPEDGYYRYQYGRSYYAVEDFENAAPIFEEVVADVNFERDEARWSNGQRMPPELALNIVLSLVYSYVNTGSVDRARRILTEHAAAKHVGTRFADFAHAQGYVALIEGDLAESRIHFERSLDLGSGAECVVGTGSFVSHYHLGLISEGEDDLETALRYYLNALELKPDHDVTLNRWVDVITEHGLVLPKPLWEVCDHEAFTQCFLDRLRTYHDGGEEQKVNLLMQTARNLSESLVRESTKILDGGGEASTL